MSLASSVGEFQRRKKKRNENVTQKKGGILLYIITNANACTAARQTATSSLHLLLSPRLVVRAAVRGCVLVSSFACRLRFMSSLILAKYA